MTDRTDLLSTRQPASREEIRCAFIRPELLRAGERLLAKMKEENLRQKQCAEEKP